jgi:A/G-specific adenine glycosylase
LALPGIGRYTAGAIVSFAYGVRAPVLEANTIRLFSRLLGLRESVETASSKTRLWQAADEILPPRGPTIGTLNQATMELGSQVCVPKVPNCHRCPVTAHCQAFGLGLQLEIPLAVPSKTFTHLRHALVIIVHRQHYLLRKNQPGQWWEGLWDFPRVDVTEEWQRLNARDRAQAFVSVVESSLSRQLGLVCQVAEPCHTLKHGVTRYRISVECFMAQVVKPNLRLSSPDWRWMSIDRLSELPLTSTAEKLRSWIVTNQYPQG